MGNCCNVNIRIANATKSIIKVQIFHERRIYGESNLAVDVGARVDASLTGASGGGECHVQFDNSRALQEIQSLENWVSVGPGEITFFPARVGKFVDVTVYDKDGTTVLLEKFRIEMGQAAIFTKHHTFVLSKLTSCPGCCGCCAFIDEQDKCYNCC